MHVGPRLADPAEGQGDRRERKGRGYIKGTTCETVKDIKGQWRKGDNKQSTTMAMEETDLALDSSRPSSAK